MPGVLCSRETVLPSTIQEMLSTRTPLSENRWSVLPSASTRRTLRKNEKHSKISAIPLRPLSLAPPETEHDSRLKQSKIPTTRLRLLSLAPPETEQDPCLKQSKIPA